MKYTNKTKISKSEHLKLVGLLSLAYINNQKQRDILKAVMEITGEKDETGHSSDAVFCDYTADDLLDILKISVAKK